jgi:hypothetical protein
LKQIKIDGGSMLMEVTEVAVVPWRSEPLRADTIVTVLATRRIAARNASCSRSSAAITA